MNTCDTCRWWDTEPYLDRAQNNLRQDCKVRQCRHEKVNGLEGNYFADDVLTQCGVDAGYPANCTGPKFGCVHHDTGTVAPTTH